MKAYLVLQLRRGDMISMHKLYSNPAYAWNYLSHVQDTDSSWWKVLEIDEPNLQPNTPMDIVIRVRWETSNTVKYVGGFTPRNVPPQYDEDRYFAETLTLEN
jgi:hypothetical protein